MREYKLGVFSWFGFLMPLPERLKMIKNAGFDATSIWWEDEESTPLVKKEDMPGMVSDAGLIFENIHVPYNICDDLWSEDRSIRDKSISEHLSWLEDCARYSIPKMVMHLTETADPPAPNRYGLESMEYLTRKAEELQIIIAVENTRRPDNVPFILDRITSGYLGMCFDTSHARIKGNDLNHLLKDYGSRLQATHISDNDTLDDRHWLPGNGTIDWPELMQLFPSDSYQGFLTMEILPTREEIEHGPKSFLQDAYNRLIDLHDLLTC